MSRLLRRLLPGIYRDPAFCLNCDGIQFSEETVINDTRYVCDECGWEHTVTFGGFWRAEPPDGEDGRPILK